MFRFERPFFRDAEVFRLVRCQGCEFDSELVQMQTSYLFIQLKASGKYKNWPGIPQRHAKYVANQPKNIIQCLK